VVQELFRRSAHAQKSEMHGDAMLFVDQLRADGNSAEQRPRE
jgi:hypothetical protein